MRCDCPHQWNSVNAMPLSKWARNCFLISRCTTIAGTNHWEVLLNGQLQWLKPCQLQISLTAHFPWLVNSIVSLFILFKRFIRWIMWAHPANQGLVNIFTLIILLPRPDCFMKKTTCHFRWPRAIFADTGVFKIRITILKSMQFVAFLWDFSQITSNHQSNTKNNI